jgi:hypothetical protein
MKLQSLISAVVLGMAVLVQAQTSPDPQAGKGTLTINTEAGAALTKPVQDANELDFSNYKALNSDGSMTLTAGTVGEMVEEIRWRCGRSGFWPKVEGDQKMEVPNLIFGGASREATAEGELKMVNVTPLDALGLVAEVAGCSLEPIYSAEQTGPKVIGYRVVGPRAEPTPRPAASAVAAGTLSIVGTGKIEPKSGALVVARDSATGTLRLSGVNTYTGETNVVTGSAAPGFKAGNLVFNSNETKPPSENDPSASASATALDNSKPLVRVYTLGAAIVGRPGESEEEMKRKAILVSEIEELIRQTLDTAGLDHTSLNLSFHRGLGVLVAKASMAQHEMIEQVVKALRESGAQAAQNPNAIPEPPRPSSGIPAK